MVKSYNIRMDDAALARLENYCKLIKITQPEAVRKTINIMVEDYEEIKI